MRYLTGFHLITVWTLGFTIVFFLGVSSVKAQVVCNPADRNQGLVSSVGLSGTFGNPLGQCVIDQKAAYVNFKIPNYDELKSIFYTQNKSITPQVLNSTSSPGCSGGNTILVTRVSLTSGTNKSLLNVQCNFTHFADTDPTNGPIFAAGSNKTVVLFADNHVYIDTNINYGGGAYGLVIIAKGDIYIAPAVTQINAVLVNQGSVYTAYTGSNPTQLVPNSQQLTVNGSLINLTQVNGSRIFFNRSLADNNVPAEIVNYQPKFLVLLRGLLTQSFTIQREIGADEIPSASLFPSPTGIPSPAPTENQGSTYKNAYCVFGVYQLFVKLNIASDTNIPCI